MAPVIKKLDIAAGKTLRFIANLVTGNSFSRIRTDIRADIKRAEKAAFEARDIARRLHDDNQYMMLMKYKHEARRD